MVAIPTRAEPPADSRIQVRETPDGPELIWNNDSGIITRVIVVLFMCAWLAGWYAGERSAIEQVTSTPAPPWPFLAFMIFWLAGWTVGGLFAIGVIFFMVFVPSRPEYLLLGPSALVSDPYWKEGEVPKGLLRRTILRPRTIQKSDIHGVKLVRDEGSLELHLDLGKKRVQLGNGLRDVDREWLAGVIEAWRRV